MFEGFDLSHIDVGPATLRVRVGGTGPPVVLLHGHPRTHVTWNRVAPLLAADFTVVCPDLRGYGQSSKPPTDDDHAPYSKRAMAGDIYSLMRGLGHERFAVVGHDRGSYVAFRLAMDHPEAVTQLVVMDGVPIGEALERAGAEFAKRWWHWFFFGQTDKPAERVIDADPDAWYGQGPKGGPPEAVEDFQQAIHDPATVHAMLEDYRAGLTIDRRHDQDDQTAGRRLACPLLVLWSSRDDMIDLYGDVVQVWRAWADDVRGAEIDSGHHMAEEAPEALAAELRAFLARTGGGTMSEVEDQRGDGEIGTCHVCGQTFATQEELSKHLMDDHDGELLVASDTDEPSGSTDRVNDDSSSGEDGSGAGQRGVTS